jgi:hypothetical protein
LVVDLRFDLFDAPMSETSPESAPNLVERVRPSAEAAPHAPTAEQRALIDQVLSAEVLEDPVGQGARGHVYLVAIPEAAGAAIARSLVRGNGTSFLRKLIETAEDRLPNSLHSSPPLSYATSVMKSPTSVSFQSAGIITDAARAGAPHPDPGPEYDSAEASFASIRLEEDGSLRLFNARLTDEGQRGGWIIDATAVTFACHLVWSAAALADELAYRGNWILALRATRLHGLASASFIDSAANPARFPGDAYTGAVVATSEQLTQQAAAVVDGLVGGLTHVLGTTERFADAISSTLRGP